MSSICCRDFSCENESLRSRIRDVEDENQELRAQNLIQNRTIASLRNELAALRTQLNEMTDTSALLTERVRQLTQQQNEARASQTATPPPLLAPSFVPPPPPPPRIRISPRQVGAGEALMTPLGVSVSSPPRHRVKPDNRQAINRSARNLENSNPGPSSEKPNYFLGSTIIPNFLSSKSKNLSSSDNISNNSDSSGEEDEICFKPKKNSKNLITRLFLNDTNGKFLVKNKKDFKSHIQPSSSRAGKGSKISDCIQYTFPKINEGMQKTDVQDVVTSVGHQIKKQKKENKRGNEEESESSSSLEFESRRKTSRNFLVDFEQDGFQADESSNGVTSDDESES